jgi:hypothetical protein
MVIWRVTTGAERSLGHGNAGDGDRPSEAGSDDEWDDGSGQGLEEMIEHADRALGTESFGTTRTESDC